MKSYQLVNRKDVDEFSRNRIGDIRGASYLAERRRHAAGTAFLSRLPNSSFAKKESSAIAGRNRQHAMWARSSASWPCSNRIAVGIWL